MRYNAAMRFPMILLGAFLALAGCATPQSVPDTVTITLVGLNDVHGELTASDERGGLVSVSAYVDALREVRARDGGAVLLIDAGDMWQGTLESNLSEGEAVVDAYNALGVAAAAIGNHEFDFGPSGPRAIPAGELARRIANATNRPCLIATSLPDALQAARREASEGDRILVAGSFYVVGPALQALGLYSPPES